MASEDDWHQKHPEANRALEADGSIEPVRPSATSQGVRSAAPPKTVLSAQVVALAKRLGLSTDEIVARIPEDTRRRTKYPVRIADDGPGLSFEHDIGIVEGVRGLIHR